MATRQHTLTLEPSLGKTIASETRYEFLNDYPFTVVASSVAKFRRGMKVTLGELKTDEHWHDVKYGLHFQTMSMIDYIKQQKEINHDFDPRNGVVAAGCRRYMK